MPDLDQAAAVALASREMHRRAWDLAELARVAKVDPGTVGDFFAGIRWPRTSTRGRIETALGLHPGSLLAAAEHRDPQPAPETVSGDDEALDFVATGKGGARGISDAGVIDELEQMQKRISEILERLRDGRT